MTDSARLSVRVHPRARSDKLSGIRDGLLHAGVTAVDPGTSNQALIGLLARRLGVGPERIVIVSGADARVKQVRIVGLGQAEADARVRAPRPVARWPREQIAAVGLAAVIAAVAIVLAQGAGPRVTRSPSPRPPARAAAGRPSVRRSSATTSASASAARSPAPAGRHRQRSQLASGPGRLPQTAELPSALTREFAARMRGLWAAIGGEQIGLARAAFFPEAAYLQLKSVGDPAGDFENRLYVDYRLDIAAAHALLGVGASRSRLLRTVAVAAYAHWVPPEVCDNRVGYYELPNVRLVYGEDGHVRSIGIASLISWRGVWYVVHLGAVVRGSAAGVVSDPSDGPGAPAPSSTC